MAEHQVVSFQTTVTTVTHATSCRTLTPELTARAKLSALRWPAHLALATRSLRSRAMKLPLPTIIFVLFSPPSAAISSRCHRPTLPPTTKKTSLSGWLPLSRAHLLLPHRSFSSCQPLRSLPPPLIPVDYSNSK